MKLLVFSYLFLSTIVYAQSGVITYKKQRATPTPSAINDYFKSAVKEMEILRYQLTYNNERAHYSKVDGMGRNEDAVVEAYTRTLTGFNGEIFINRQSNQLIHKKEFAGQKFFIKKNKIEWTLKADTLIVDKFLCYKATTSETISNSKGNHKIEIIAWYAPELSLPLGPDGYGGLPGLVMQLERNGTITSIESINFFNEKLDVDFLDDKNIKIIDEASFNKITASVFNSRKDSKN